MAYNSATIVQKDPPGPDNRVHIVVVFEGNAGEEAVKMEYYISAGTTQASLNEWARTVVEGLENRKTASDQLEELQKIDLSIPAEKPPSAQVVWLRKVQKLRFIEALGLKNPTAVADVEALRADIEADYDGAFIPTV